jgi:hypothetical protein
MESEKLEEVRYISLRPKLVFGASHADILPFCTCYIPNTPFQCLAVQFNSRSSFRMRSFVRAYVPPLVAQLTCRTACQPSLTSCLERRARSELASSSRIRPFYHLSTCQPYQGRSRAKCASVSVRRGETMNHKQGTIPMILADSAIGFLYHHTTSLYSFPLTTTL